jgi:hypothetical protein
LDYFEGIAVLLCGGLSGFVVCYLYVAVFGGYGGFWVEA